MADLGTLLPPFVRKKDLDFAERTVARALRLLLAGRFGRALPDRHRAVAQHGARLRGQLDVVLSVLIVVYRIGVYRTLAAADRTRDGPWPMVFLCGAVMMSATVGL